LTARRHLISFNHKKYNLCQQHDYGYLRIGVVILGLKQYFDYHISTGGIGPGSSTPLEKRPEDPLRHPTQYYLLWNQNCTLVWKQFVAIIYAYKIRDRPEIQYAPLPFFFRTDSTIFAQAVLTGLKVVRRNCGEEGAAEVEQVAELSGQLRSLSETLW